MNRVLAGLTPWTGLLAGSVAWALHQQLLADALRFNCAAVSPGRALLALALALALCLTGAVVSWRSVRGTGDASAGRAFAGRLSILGAGIFALAVAMQGVASFTVPGCFR
jgi:hypothetical protein